MCCAYHRSPMTSRVETVRRAMKDAEAAFREAARERDARPGPHTQSRYQERLETLIAAYDAVRLVDPRWS